MIAILNTLFALRYDYTDVVARQRGRALLSMAWISLLVWALAYFGVVLPLINRGDIQTTGWMFVSMTALPLVLSVIIVAVQLGRLRAASLIFVAALLGISVPLGLVAYIDLIQLLPILGLIAAGVLLDRRELLIVTIICLISVYLTAQYQSTIVVYDRTVPAEQAFNEFIAMTAIMLAAAAVLFAFSGTPERISRTSNLLAEQWRAIGALTVRSAVDEAGAIETALRIAQRDLRFEVTQVFLMTDRTGNVRRYRLGDSGMVTLDVQADLVVQDVLTRFEPVILRTSDRRAADHLINPAIMSVSLPIQYEGTLLGVLDLQSASTIATDAMRLAVMNQLAGQIGRGLAQFRRTSALENDVREQEGTAARLRAQIADLQRRAEGTTSTGWERYLRGFGVTGYGYDLESSGGSLVNATDLPPRVRTALERGEVHISRDDRHQIISAPIAYRGQMLGAMVFEVPLERTIGADEIELLGTIADRLGNALENNRLFEQNQAQAQRERKASDVGGLLLSATDVEQILTLAAETFNEALGATHTRVSVQSGLLEEIMVTPTSNGGSHPEPGKGGLS